MNQSDNNNTGEKARYGWIKGVSYGVGACISVFLVLVVPDGQVTLLEVVVSAIAGVLGGAIMPILENSLSDGDR